MSLFFNGGVSATNADGLAYLNQNPITGGAAAFCSTGCNIIITPSWYNAVASELLAIPDKLGFSYNVGSVTNAADALKNKFDNIALKKADKVTKITPQGLAVGGGDLTQDRVIDVPKASQAEALAGIDDTTAITPLKLKSVSDALKNSILNGAILSLDTLAEIGAAFNNDPNFANNITNLLQSEANTRAANDTAEANARANADTGLQNQIDAMSVTIANMQTQINKLIPTQGGVL